MSFEKKSRLVFLERPSSIALGCYRGLIKIIIDYEGDKSLGLYATGLYTEKEEVEGEKAKTQATKV